MKKEILDFTYNGFKFSCMTKENLYLFIKRIDDYKSINYSKFITVAVNEEDFKDDSIKSMIDDGITRIYTI